MDISAKYSCAHFHAWATGHSNLTNSAIYSSSQKKFTYSKRITYVHTKPTQHTNTVA